MKLSPNWSRFPGQVEMLLSEAEEHRQVVSEAAVKDVSEHIIKSPETSRLAAPDALSEADLFLAARVLS